MFVWRNHMQCRLGLSNAGITDNWLSNKVWLLALAGHVKLLHALTRRVVKLLHCPRFAQWRLLCSLWGYSGLNWGKMLLPRATSALGDSRLSGPSSPWASVSPW